MTSPHDADPPPSPELEDRILRAERGEGGAASAFQRLIGAIRADRADRPSPEVLSRIVAMGAPRPVSADGRPWWQAIELAVANLVGRIAPGDLAGVRSGTATAEHLAFETDDLAIDVAITALEGDRWRLEGVVEQAAGSAATDEVARIAAFSIGQESQAIESTIAPDGRFAFTMSRRPDRLVVERQGHAATLHLDSSTSGRD